VAAQTYTATALSKLLDLTLARVGQLAKEGVLKKRRDKRYAASAITAYVRYLREHGRKKTNYTELLEAEKYRQKKRENDIEEELVAPVQVLEDVLERGVAAMIPILEGIPLHVKRAWPEITGDQIQLVKQAIAECRNILADLEIDLDE
jgi:phage terminase Nu1 subunit (DNA packaging protein)